MLVTLVKRRPSAGLLVVALLGLVANLTGLGIPESDPVHRLPTAIERAAGRQGDVMSCYLVQLQALMRSDGPTDRRRAARPTRYCKHR